MPNKKRILGIDPGYERLGIAILENVGRDSRVIYSECFRTEAQLFHPERLKLISEKINKIIAEFKPDFLAIETLIFSKNTKTALKIAEVRGVVMSLAAMDGLEINEFHPNAIKLATTGYGRADKKQIISMIRKILKLEKKIKYDDEYDAIAVALTCGVTPAIHTNP